MTDEPRCSGRSEWIFLALILGVLIMLAGPDRESHAATDTATQTSMIEGPRR